MARNVTRLGRSRVPGLVVCSLALLAAVGCVTPGAYHRVSTERDRLVVTRLALEERVRQLEIGAASLEEEVAALKDEREDLRIARAALERELAKTRASEAQLADRLAARDAALSVTASALIEESRKVGELTETYDSLVGELEAELAAGEIRVEQLRDGLQVDVAQDILFGSGSVALSPSGAAVLKRVAERLAALPYTISVEGHSDSVPIRGSLQKQYPTNWELAAARAAQVVRLFVENGIDGSKLAVVSHGPYRPIADESTPTGRARNRRIEILLRPDEDAAPAAPVAP